MIKKIIIQVEYGMVIGVLSNFEDVEILVIDNDTEGQETDIKHEKRVIKEFGGKDIFYEIEAPDLGTEIDPKDVIRMKEAK